MNLSNENLGDFYAFRANLKDERIFYFATDREAVISRLKREGIEYSSCKKTRLDKVPKTCLYIPGLIFAELMTNLRKKYRRKVSETYCVCCNKTWGNRTLGRSH